MEQLNRAEYIVAVKAIKEAIQISRYRAAKLVNKEVLALYYAVGRYISLNSRHASYGSSALRVISDQLQQEMPGLKGFSESSLKRMRKFYEDWSELIENRPPVADDLNADSVGKLRLKYSTSYHHNPAKNSVICDTIFYK